MSVQRDPGTRPDYDEYIVSAEWRCRREQYILTQDYACRRCHATRRRLHLHHLTYDRLGAELDTDLCWLCPMCHMLTHLQTDSLEPVGGARPLTPEHAEVIERVTRQMRLRVVVDALVECQGWPWVDAYTTAVAYVYGETV